MVPVIFNCFLDSLWNGVKSSVSSVGKAVLSPISYGVKSLFGQSEMQQYERQLSRNEAYQKQMLDYTNEANFKYNKDLTKFINEQTKEMSKYFYDSYQSPAAQVQAYKQAGLNPYMLSSPGSFSPTASSSAVGGASPSSPGGSYQRDQPISALDGIQYKNLSSQADYNAAQTEYMNELTEGVRLDNDKKRTESRYWAQNAANQARSFALGNDLTEKEIDEIVESINLKKVEANLKAVMSEKEATLIGNLLVDRAFVGASIEEKYKMMEINYKNAEQQLNVGKATAAMLYANASYLEAIESMTEDQRKVFQEMAGKITTEKEILEFEKKMKENDSKWQNVKNFNQNVIAPFLATAQTLISAINPFSGLFTPKPNPIGFR